MTELQAERAGKPLGVPRIEAKSQRSRYLDVLIAIAAFAVLATLPFLFSSKALLDFVIRCAAFGLFATSLNLLVGYTGMISFGLRRATNVHRQSLLIDKAARERLNGHKAVILWFTGLSGSGKSTIANIVERELHARGAHTYLLDGDNVRHGLNRDLGFTDADRVENIRRVGEVAKLFVEAGAIVLCSFISPFRAERRMVRELVDAGEFIEVFIDTPLAECLRRDPGARPADASAVVRLLTAYRGRSTPAVPSGRSVSERVSRSLKV